MIKKYLFYFYKIISILILLISFEVFANNIGVINLNKIFENNIAFQNLIKTIVDNKNNAIESLNNERNEIDKLKKQIDSERLILDQTELEKLVNSYNNKINEFNIKVNTIESKTKKIIEENEQILIQEVVKIVSNIAENRNLDLILTETNYFMISDNIDLTNEIIDNLEKQNIKFNFNN